MHWSKIGSSEGNWFNLPNLVSSDYDWHNLHEEQMLSSSDPPLPISPVSQNQSLHQKVPKCSGYRIYYALGKWIKLEVKTLESSISSLKALCVRLSLKDFIVVPVLN